MAVGLFAPGQVKPAAQYIPFEDAKPILASNADFPSELKALKPAALAAAWPQWVARKDAEIRARLERGEEDSLANLLMFGNSFTRQPRITPEFMASLEAGHPAGDEAGARTLIQIFEARVDDLLRRLAHPGSNERLQMMSRMLERKGYSPADDSGQAQLRSYLLATVARVRQELKTYSEQMQAIRAAPDSRQAFAERSRLFETRGIALDTSLLPNFALEQALRQLRARGLLATGTVRRVAIIGPGLDFVDKDEGYDFYPPQTLQPFALFESLMRLGLASPGLRVTTFDISSRVNDHIARARRRVQQGDGYVVQLPRNPSRAWNQAAVQYWEQFGNMIGRSVPPVKPPPGLDNVLVRAVRIRPDVVARVLPVDLNIVYQRLSLPKDQTFDLIVATNVFVYYGPFDQQLAMVNVGHMLRPGGLLLSNDALAEAPSSGVRNIGDTTVVYGKGSANGDRIVWYQRQQ